MLPPISRFSYLQSLYEDRKYCVELCKVYDGEIGKELEKRIVFLDGKILELLKEINGNSEK